MKILMVNVVCGIRSTGRICTDLAYALKQSGNEVKIAYGRKQAPAEFQDMSIRVGNGIDNLSHAALSRLFDAQGYGSVRATKKFIKWVEEYNPDIIHLHNIHGYYLNITLLFDFLKKRNKPVVWTLHDMWAFTGHAAFCVGVPCFRYIEGCFDCPRKKAYPESLLDRSELNWRRKRNLIRSLTKLNIVVPSYWLADITKKSFLGIYPIHVIHNGVDTKNFKPVKHDIRKKYGIKKEKIALGVAAIWDERKGLMDLVELSQKLDEEYQFIVVGLTNRQMESLPSNIIGIQHTNSVQELAELYSAADVFVNPTYVDNYPTTNIEAIACGTPVITYDTGGSGESASKFGCVVKRGDKEEMKKAIKEYAGKKLESGDPMMYDVSVNRTIEQYLALYSSLIRGGVKRTIFLIIIGRGVSGGLHRFSGGAEA